MVPAKSLIDYAREPTPEEIADSNPKKEKILNVIVRKNDSFWMHLCHALQHAHFTHNHYYPWLYASKWNNGMIKISDHSYPPHPVSSLPQTSHLSPVADLDSLAILEACSPFSHVSHTVRPSELSLSMWKLGLVLSFVETTIRHLVAPCHSLPSSENAGEGLTGFVPDHSFSFE